MAFPIPFWKRWLSYLMEFEIERVPSGFDYDLSVCLSDGRLQLVANNAIYSWEDKYDNFSKAFAKIDWENEKIEDVLVLGLGLASIPQMLEQLFKQKFQYTGIEFDEEVIYLAEKYILKDLKSPITIIEADAKIFVEIDYNQYDMIAIDIFVGTKIPEDFLTIEFLQHIKQRLKPGGIVFFNHLTNHQEELDAMQNYFDVIFLQEFQESTALEVGGNHILINREINL